MSDDRFVGGLAALDAGGLARLRRAAGQTLAESRNIYDVFFRLVPSNTPQHQETYFLVATLYALTARGSDLRPTSGGLSLGTALHNVRRAQLDAAGRSQDDTISLDRRVAALLDADREQLTFRLRQIVRLIHSREQTLDWQKLLGDLLGWSYPSRSVQQRWAREYYIGVSAAVLPQAIKEATQ